MIAACAAVLPQLAAAQVEKQVEVTKAYVPRVESASKLAVEPDMTDTTHMRPEIDYTVTPLSLHTTLTTRPIRPATVTYWEFNRPLPFYVKVGAGYPLNSVLDFYATTQNPSTGYAMAYVNHEGRYAKIANEIGEKNNSTRMYNRAGVAAGKYIGRHTLEGEVFYDNRMYHRYGSYTTDPNPSEEQLRSLGAGAMTDYGDAQARLRFGDDFQDLSRLNFEVELHGGLFFDHSDWAAPGMQGGENTIGAQGRMAWAWGRSRFGLGLAYDYLAGQKYVRDSRQQLIRAGLRYGFQGGVVRLDVGADYYRDRIEPDAGPEIARGNYIIPYARLDFNLGTPGLKPFIEADGAVRPNDLRSLTLQNPYVTPGAWFDKSSVDYNFRAGLGGTLWNKRFAYRLYAELSVEDNHLFWATLLEHAGAADEYELFASAFVPRLGRQTVTSFNGEIEYRPLSSLMFELGVHGRFYNEEFEWSNGEASFVGHVGINYSGRKISFGVGARMESERRWSTLDYTFADEVRYLPAFEVPFTVDLYAHFDWRVSHRVTLFVEGRNLADQPRYDFARYPELGANFTAGVKINF